MSNLVRGLQNIKKKTFREDVKREVEGGGLENNEE